MDGSHVDNTQVVPDDWHGTKGERIIKDADAALLSQNTLPFVESGNNM